MGKCLRCGGDHYADQCEAWCDFNPSLEEELDYALVQERAAWKAWSDAQDHRRKIQEEILKRNAANPTNDGSGG